MSEIVFLLEEPSAEALLKGLLPRLAPAVRYRCIVFEGKQDLDKQLVRRIRGYRDPDASFVILRDQDSGDCLKLKRQLRDKCREAGKPESLIRIACRELESWYLADLQAVETGLGVKQLAKKQDMAKYRHPDRLSNAAAELGKLTSGVYQKVGGSRALGPLLALDNSRSRSFAVFVSGLRKLFASQQEGDLEPT